MLQHKIRNNLNTLYGRIYPEQSYQKLLENDGKKANQKDIYIYIKAYLCKKTSFIKPLSRFFFKYTQIKCPQ